MNPNKPDTKAEIAVKRATRAAKRLSRAAKWIRRAERHRVSVTRSYIENNGPIRAMVLETLRKGNGTSKSVLYGLVYRLCNPTGQSKKTSRLAANSVLETLYLEGTIEVVAGKNPPRHRRDLNKPLRERTVSMIYLRPTNDIPVNRLAASVIGPVWGASGLL